MAYTFKGGSHVAEHKNTEASAIEKLPAPKTVAIPMSQHIGAPCVPTVKVGDKVLRGQRIGKIEGGGLGCPVHSSVSGVVREIISVNDARAVPIKTVVIENDGLDTLDESIAPFPKKLSEATTEDIIELVRQAGISGMGGATFPTYAKIASAVDKVDRLIINCAECEPFITANHRLMLERPHEIINGTKILLKALGLKDAYIAIENNKMDAVAKIEEKIAQSKMINICVMKTKYPQGDERQLIYAITGKELPAGKLPSDVGCVVFNAETCASIYRAFATGMPLVERIVTVDGDCVQKPKNILAPIGASYRDLVEFCGGLKKTPKKIINGGPMMGVAQWNIDGSVTKGTSAVLVLSEEMCAEDKRDHACIRCGRCVKNCPMHLMPNYLAQFAHAGRYSDADKYNILSCVECGTCSYNCPGHVPIVQYIRAAKGTLKAQKSAERAKAKENANITIN